MIEGRYICIKDYSCGNYSIKNNQVVTVTVDKSEPKYYTIIFKDNGGQNIFITITLYGLENNFISLRTHKIRKIKEILDK